MDSKGESDLFPMIAPPALPTFDLALRGYDRRQVDEYLDRLEHDLSVAQGDRDAASARIALTEKRLDELEAELQAARTELTESNHPTYAGLGKRVEQLLSIAEEEAARLRADAMRDTEEERAAAGTLVQQAQQEADKARREFEANLDARRRKAEQQEAEVSAETDKRLAAAEQQIADAEAAAEKPLAAARTEADRLVTDATAHIERLRKDADQHATALLQAARHDVERVALEAKSKAETIITEARATAEQGRVEYDREIAELIQRRQSIREQLRALRQVVGTLPDADHEDDTTLVTPVEDKPDKMADQTGQLPASDASGQQASGPVPAGTKPAAKTRAGEQAPSRRKSDQPARPEQGHTNELFGKIGT